MAGFLHFAVAALVVTVSLFLIVVDAKVDRRLDKWVEADHFIKDDEVYNYFCSNL